MRTDGLAQPVAAVKQRWAWFWYQRRFAVRVTRCSNCARELAVIPAELTATGKRGERLVEKAPRDAVHAERDGLFECPCGALGWIGGRHVRSPTHRSAPPTDRQRCLMELLAAHPEGIAEREL